MSGLTDAMLARGETGERRKTIRIRRLQKLRSLQLRPLVAEPSP